MSDFERFKRLYQQYCLTYKGIEINRAICLEVWLFANHKIMTGPKTVLRNLFCVKDVHRMDTNCEILTTCCSGRRDYLEIYENLVNNLGSKTTYNAPYTWPDKYHFRPSLIFQIIRKSLKLLKGAELSLLEKIALSTVACYYCNTLSELQKMDFSRVKKYVCEIDVNRFENLLTQYMNQQSIPTFTMEEGLFYVFKGNIPIDSVHYELLTSNYLLCWGQYVTDEYKSFGIKEERLKLAGYPRKVEKYHFRNDNHSFKRCVVLLARKQFDEANFKLLKILGEISGEYNFHLKLHPSCDFQKYKVFADNHNMIMVEKAKTINDCLNPEAFDWAIAVNTTAYYESLMKGVPCFRFEDDIYQLPYGYEDKFETVGQLSFMIDTLKSKDIDIYQKEIDAMLEYTMGIGINNYKEIILS